MITKTASTLIWLSDDTVMLIHRLNKLNKDSDGLEEPIIDTTEKNKYSSNLPNTKLAAFSFSKFKIPTPIKNTYSKSKDLLKDKYTKITTPINSFYQQHKKPIDATILGGVALGGGYLGNKLYKAQKQQIEQQKLYDEELKRIYIDKLRRNNLYY